MLDGCGQQGAVSFGQELRRRRVEAGLTQERLAEQAGLSVRGLSDLERDVRRTPYPDTVERLAAALGLDELRRAALFECRRRSVPRSDGQHDHGQTNSLSGDGALHNLPIEPTRLIGREREVEHVRRQLLEPDVRLVTLTGAGGSGKTRVALAVAAALLDTFKDGVWLVELAALTDPELVPSAVASSLGVTQRRGRSVRETLLEALQTRSVLLVFDNCEHLVHACATLAHGILDTCRSVRILASSREPLRIAAERTWQVPTLPQPDPCHMPALEELTNYPAVQLFVERTRAVQHAFALNVQNGAAVAGICARLDGLPLAIELAAARMQVLAPEQILERLDDAFRLLVGGRRTAPTRQQTLTATLDWSWVLLEEREQRLFERLSVFVGAWDLAAAEVVCVGGEVTTDAVLDLLAQLVNKSLVGVESTTGESSARYRFLEVVRQYALERLEARHEVQAFQDRHFNFFGDLAHVAGMALRGPEQQVWLDRLDREHGNLRGALTWTRNHGQVTAGLKMAVDLWRFWSIRGHLAEGREWLATLLELSDSQLVPIELLSAGQSAQGHLTFAQGDWARAELCFETSLALSRESGDSAGVAASIRDLGTVAQGQGEYDRAYRLLVQSLSQWRELGDMAGVATCLDDLGEIARHRGDYDQAAELDTESLALKRNLGDVCGAAFSLNELANVARHRGDYKRGQAFASEALALQREIGDRRGTGYSLNNLGIMAQVRGEHQAAAHLYEEALMLFREAGDKRGLSVVLPGLSGIAQARGDLEAARVLAEQALELHRELGEDRAIAQRLGGLGRIACAAGDTQRAWNVHRESLALFSRIGDKRGVAMALDGIATVAALDGHSRFAAELFGVANALRDAIHAAPDFGAYVDTRVGERAVAELRHSLGDEAFAQAWESGRSLPVAQAITEVLSSNSLPLETRAGKPSPRQRGSPLTSRERDVVRLVAEGRTNREIGGALVISAGTARVHVEHVLAKLGLRSRAQIAVWAVEHDLT